MCLHRVHEGGVERVVVLLERVLRVVQHQLLQRRVDVVRLGETEPSVRLVDDAVVHLAVTPKHKIKYPVRKIFIFNSFKVRKMTCL
jgi:hypothetical protein